MVADRDREGCKSASRGPHNRLVIGDGYGVREMVHGCISGCWSCCSLGGGSPEDDVLGRNSLVQARS